MGESGAAVAKLPQYRFSGAGPIVRISTSLFPRLWPGRTGIVLDAEYFTEVLNSHSGWLVANAYRIAGGHGRGGILFRFRRDRRQADYQMVRLAV